jgi:membrane fusion protein
MNALFRPAAVAQVRRRLDGEALLAAPLPSRLIALLLATIVLAAALFAASATYARKETVTGWLVPDHGLIRASAPAAGLIAAVLVAEGDVVARGQRLAEIALASDTATGNAGVAQARALRQEADAAKARGAVNLARLAAENDQVAARLGNLRRELAEVRAQAALQEQRVALAESQVASTEGLAAKGLVSQREMEGRRSAALGARQDLAGHRRQAAGIERELGDLAGRLAALPIEMDAARADAQLADAALQQRMSEAETRRAVVVLAPVAGRVAALPVSVGQPVASGATLAIITPVDGVLEAELLAPSRAIGFIKPGQPVRLALQAFPYQRFGAVAGVIKTVSSTVLGPTEIAIPGASLHEPVFRVRISLAGATLDAYGESHPLQPGMLLSADIILDRRSLLRWLFDPLYAVGRRT